MTNAMVKLRLKRCGRKQHATYRIVAIDVRSRTPEIIKRVEEFVQQIVYR